MRQVKLLALMIPICLLLGSCSSKQTVEEKAMELQAEYAAWEKLTITADISADYGDSVYDFKLQYTGNETEGTVCVLSPTELAGLTAELTKENSYLVYDGAELSLSELTTDGLSPMDCLPMMIGQWAGGYISGAETEAADGIDALAVTYAVSDDVSLKTWFEYGNNLPVKAEIYFKDSMVIYCEFENIVT